MEDAAITESLLESNSLNYIVNFFIDILRAWMSSKCENGNICGGVTTHKVCFHHNGVISICRV